MLNRKIHPSPPFAKWGTSLAWIGECSPLWQREVRWDLKSVMIYASPNKLLKAVPQTHPVAWQFSRSAGCQTATFHR